MLARSAAAVVGRRLPALPHIALRAQAVSGVDQYVPRLASVLPRAVSTVSTGTVLSIAATPTGRVHVNTPLPGVAGVVDLDLPPRAKVSDLIASVHEADSSVKQVQVQDVTGATVSASTPLAFLLTRRVSLLVDDLELKAVPTGAGASISAALEALRGDGEDASTTAYDSLRSTLLDMARTQRSIPYTQYVDLVRQAAGACSHGDPATGGIVREDVAAAMAPGGVLELAQDWLALLHVDGVALHFASSPDPELRHKVLLQPPSATSSLLTDALDVSNSRDKAKLSALAGSIAAAEATVSHMTRVARDILSRAELQANVAAWSLGIGMVAQYGFFLSFIYVTSWDFAEPLLYFVSFGYGIVGVLYFLAAQRDPVSSNLYETLVAWRRRALHRKLDASALGQACAGDALETWRDVPAFERLLQARATDLSAAMREVQVLAQRVEADAEAEVEAARQALKAQPEGGDGDSTAR